MELGGTPALLMAADGKVEVSSAAARSPSEGQTMQGNNTRISNAPPSWAPTTNKADAPHAIKGSMRGEGVELRAAADVDDVYRAKTQVEAARGMLPMQAFGTHAAGVRGGSLAMHVDDKPLSSRKGRLDQPVKPMRPAHLVQAQRNEQNGSEARQLGLKLLREGKWPPTQPGARGAVVKHLALQSVAAFLDDETDEEEALALLTPAKGPPGGARELAEMLQQAGDDAHKLAELLEDVEGLPKDPSELYQLLKNVRYDPAALTKLLREKQGLPTDKSKLGPLRQQVHDALRELDRTDGPVIRARLNGGAVAAKAADPAAFLDAYGEIVHGSGGFTDTLKKLLERFPAKNLRNAVESMKKALGDDLSATVAMPSSDPVRLQSILTDLSHMHISTTLIEMVDTLIERLKRTLNAQPAASAT